MIRYRNPKILSWIPGVIVFAMISCNATHAIGLAPERLQSWRGVLTALRGE
jgi:hypothetical protein